MADLRRQPPSQPTHAPRAPRAGGAADAVAGTSEARAWWQQLGASVPRWLLPAVLVSLVLGLLLLWSAHA